jgi:hypothetical protein
MIEILKQIESYPNYVISNLGYVKSLRTYKVLKVAIDKRGYEKVSLYNDAKKKTFLMHRLVAIAFIENPENKNQVNHIDGCKTNNKSSNLEWNTCRENILHANALGLFYEKNKSISKKMSALLKGKSFNHKNVIDLQTGLFYKSLTEACNRHNLSYSTEVKRTRKQRNNRFQYI